MKFKAYKPEETRWLVEDLIPIGETDVFCGQPGKGKSFILENLAVAVACGEDFLGIKTKGGNVLLIDEDTDSQTLQNRLYKFMNNYGHKESVYNLDVISKEGFQFGDLPKKVAEYNDLKLVIVDCIAAISGSVDIDGQSSNKIGNIMQSLKSKDATVIFVHHISTKNPIINTEYIVTCDSPERLVMNNTRIVSACDTLFMVASVTANEKLSEVIIRPVARRKSIPMKTFSAKIEENHEKHVFKFNKTIDYSRLLSKDEKDVLSQFDNPEIEEEYQDEDFPEHTMTFRMVSNKFYGALSDNTIRDVIKSLEDKGYLNRYKRLAHNEIVFERIKEYNDELENK